MPRAIILLGLLGLLVATAAHADEQKVAVKDLPKPVLAAVKARFPAARITEATRDTERGKTTFEVELKDKGESVDVSLSAQGKILEIGRPIDVQRLPKPVAATLAAQFPRAKITEAEEMVNFEDDEEETYYWVVLALKGKEDVEVSLSPAGAILDDEADDEDDDKAKAKDKHDSKTGGKDAAKHKPEPTGKTRPNAASRGDAFAPSR